MASFTTVINEFSNKENSRTYEVTGHSVNKPKLVLQKRRANTSGQTTVEDSLSVIYGTEDSNGVYLDPKIVFTFTARRPKAAISTDVDAALVVMRDLFASDEVTAMIAGQSLIQ